jgi:aminoglycoside phosphotransferase (APT) family kinase protein
MDVVLGDELLAELALIVGRGGLTYVEPLQLLTGGYFTENHRFRLADVPAPWDRTLVLRLFPNTVPEHVVRLEATVQRGIAAAGLPTPEVVHFDIDARLDGRRYFVMAFMSGVPMMGGINLGTMLRQGPRLLSRLSHMTAEVQVQLHSIDPTPIIDQVGDTPIRLDRWFDRLQEVVDAGATGFEDARRWLIENRPPEAERLVLCHGDLHPGNLLVDQHGRMTAILDWTVATLAEPALDVGFTTMALSLAPIDATPFVQRVVRFFGRGIARRYVRAYVARDPIDLSAQPYYEALRCAMEVGNAALWRLAVADGRPEEMPRPTWDSIAEVMVEYFAARTGVDIVLPAPVLA